MFAASFNTLQWGPLTHDADTVRMSCDELPAWVSLALGGRRRLTAVYTRATGGAVLLAEGTYSAPLSSATLPDIFTAALVGWEVDLEQWAVDVELLYLPGIAPKGVA